MKKKKQNQNIEGLLFSAGGMGNGNTLMEIETLTSFSSRKEGRKSEMTGSNQK